MLDCGLNPYGLESNQVMSRIERLCREGIPFCMIIIVSRLDEIKASVRYLEPRRVLSTLDRVVEPK